MDWHTSYSVQKNGAVLPRCVPHDVEEPDAANKWPQDTKADEGCVVTRKGLYVQDALYMPTADWAALFVQLLRRVEQEGFPGVIFNRRAFMFGHPWFENHLFTSTEAVQAGSHVFAFFQKKLPTAGCAPFEVSMSVHGASTLRTVGVLSEATAGKNRVAAVELRFAQPLLMYWDNPIESIALPFELTVAGHTYHVPGGETAHEGFVVTDAEANLLSCMTPDGFGPLTEVLGCNRVIGACAALWGFCVPRDEGHEPLPAGLRMLRSHIIGSCPPPVRRTSWQRSFPSPKYTFVPGAAPGQLGFLYIVREREYLAGNRPVYKAGMSVQEPDNFIKRLKSYKKGSEIVMVLQCAAAHVHRLEGIMLTRMRSQFDSHGDGNEYFTGDPTDMCHVLWEVVQGSSSG